jgi:AcrR family transcriptional regulator
MNSENATPKKGRPRSTASRESILSAAFDVLCERGYPDMAIESVAARAGVGKTTIYRWWSSRQELAVDAFFTATQAEIAFPSTGSAQEDFRQQIQQLAFLLRGKSGQAMSGMIMGAQYDPVLKEAIIGRWVAPRRQWGRARMERAVAEGECVDGLDINRALEVLYSPIYARMLFGMSVPSEEEVEASLAIIFQGIFRPTN